MWLLCQCARPAIETFQRICPAAALPAQDGHTQLPVSRPCRHINFFALSSGAANISICFVSEPSVWIPHFCQEPLGAAAGGHSFI
jgi:hypothetical protein